MVLAGMAMLTRGLALRGASSIAWPWLEATRPETGRSRVSTGGLPDGHPGPGPVWSEPAGAPTEAPTASPATPAEPPTPPAEAAIPIVPSVDAAAKARLREVHGRGLELGAQPGVFAKVGDSITVSTFFLADVGCGHERLADHVDLAATIEFFRAAPLPGDGAAGRCAAVNSFTRASRAAGRGWIAVQLLSPMDSPDPECPPPDDTPLRCELRRIRPAIALVMIGTNDVHQGVALRSYRASLATVTAELLERGVIPVLSTLPHRTDSWSANARIGDYNAVVREVAAEAGVPLWNYWRALQGPDMVRRGMEPDGIHPNANAHGVNLSANGLRYGYNQRNLGALMVLDKLRRIVLEDGAPDA